MGKFYVIVNVNQTKYRICKEDIKRATSFKVKKLPKIPTFRSFHNDKESDEMTNADECEVQF